MRTTLDIPEELLEEARRAARFSTKREDLRRLAGRIDLKIDLR